MTDIPYLMFMSRRGPLSRRAYVALASASLAGVAGCQADSTRSEPKRTDTQATGVSTTTHGTTAEADGTATPTDTDTPDGGSDDPIAVEQSLADLSFEGSWFDTHAHWDANMSDPYTPMTNTLDLMATYDVGASVLFTNVGYFARDYEQTVQTLAHDDVGLVPFLSPMGGGQFYSIRDQMGQAAYGIGELIYYAGALKGQPIQSQQMDQYFEYAAKEALVLMLHPTSVQADGIGPMLTKHPDTTLLLHGKELLDMGEGFLADLLADHDNCYWSYDVTTMLRGMLTDAGSPSAFADRFDANRDSHFDRVMQRLPPLLDAAPDRVMWGSDFDVTRTLNDTILSRYMSFSEDVLNAIQNTHRDPYAYENAVALFSN